MHEVQGGINEYTTKYKDEKMNELLSTRMKKWMNLWVQGWINEWTTEYKDE